MTVIEPADPKAPDLSNLWLEHAPSPMAVAHGPTHIVRDINPPFRRLIDRPRIEVVGRPFCELLPNNSECLALLDHVFQTGQPATHTEPQRAGPAPAFWSCTMWPLMAGGRPTGVVIQMTELEPPNERTLAMNEALLLGSLRQHELTEAADLANAQLQIEIAQRTQSERDARLLAQEITHRIKNNLQVVIALIANERRRTPAEFASGYRAMEARIASIAELYELISQSGHAHSVSLDAYLQEIAKTMSASLLSASSGIRIDLTADAADIDPARAVPLGLLVNELGTNAIKHAFPGGTGRLTLDARRVGERIVLTIADDGVGIAPKGSSRSPGKHGSDYVAIFVRQLGGALEMTTKPGAGTVFRIEFPLVAPPAG